MRAINHALTGSLIGLLIDKPVLAVPLAVISHFVCDIIPHYGANLPDTQEIRSTLFRRLLYADTLLCGGLVLLLAVRRPSHWWLAAICAFAAAAPDFASIGQFRRATAHQPLQPGAYIRFAHAIQWFERPIGAVVEVAWFVGAVILLVPLLR